MKKICLLILLLLIGSFTNAQKKYLEKNKTYLSARIYEPGTGTMKVRKLTLINDSVLTFKIVTSLDTASRLTRLPTNQIKYVQVKKGTYAGAGALYGGSVMLLSALYAVLQVKNNPNLNSDGYNFAPIIFGLTGGGVVLGALVGVCFSRWETRYAPDFRTAYNLRIAPYINKDYYALGIKANF